MVYLLVAWITFWLITSLYRTHSEVTSQASGSQDSDCKTSSTIVNEPLSDDCNHAVKFTSSSDYAYGLDSSELQSPAEERPKRYATEDTPNVFSRASSLSSLQSRGDEMGGGSVIGATGGGAQMQQFGDKTYSAKVSLHCAPIKDLQFYR